MKKYVPLKVWPGSVQKHANESMFTVWTSHNRHVSHVRTLRVGNAVFLVECVLGWPVRPEPLRK